MRVATFNILHGRSVNDGRIDVDRFVNSVRRLDVDILALQEVDRDQPRSQGADFTALAAEAMGAVEHRFVAALAGTPGTTWIAATGDEQPGSATYGIALLSRYPAQAWRTIRLAPLRLRVPVFVEGRRRPVLAKEEPRVAVAAQFDTPFGCVTAVNTHLSFVPGWNVLQMHRLLRGVADAPDPLVLLGDLNMPGDRPARITGFRPLANVLTFPVGHPNRQLDHVLVRGNLGPAKASEAILLPISDHRAVVVDL